MATVRWHLGYSKGQLGGAGWFLGSELSSLHFSGYAYVALRMLLWLLVLISPRIEIEEATEEGIHRCQVSLPSALKLEFREHQHLAGRCHIFRRSAASQKRGWHDIAPSLLRYFLNAGQALVLSA